MDVVLLIYVIPYPPEKTPSPLSAADMTQMGEGAYM
jgi:hypothetical protein